VLGSYSPRSGMSSSFPSVLVNGSIVGAAAVARA
jgi:hypothetical protein